MYIYIYIQTYICTYIYIESGVQKTGVRAERPHPQKSDSINECMYSLHVCIIS